MTKEKDYFKTFCKVSKAFGSTLSKEKLLDLIVQSAIDTMEAKAACLFLADEKRDIFIPTAQKGLSDNYLHAKPLRAKSIVKAVLKGGYLTIRDATTDPRVENHEAKKAEGIASLLDVPVMVMDKVIGVLALYTAEPRDFSTEEVEFLTALAEQGGMAIERARLLERIRSNSMLFLDLASAINSSLDVKKILNNLTVDLSEALGMKGVIIRLLNKEDGNLPGKAIKLALPLYKQNAAPPYPLKARRLGYEGIVMLKVLIDENGRVADLTVFKSSGHRVLDRAALSAVKKWLFEPGTEGGVKKKMWVKIPVHFDLN